MRHPILVILFLILTAWVGIQAIEYANRRWLHLTEVHHADGSFTPARNWSPWRNGGPLAD